MSTDTSIETRMDQALQRIPSADSIGHEWKTDAMKAHRWERLKRELLDNGVERVILLGAGRHTHDLIESGWPGPEIQISCIVDDRPLTESIRAIPVVRPDQAGAYLSASTVILPSSDAHEDLLVERAQSTPELRDAEIRRVYTDPDSHSYSHDQIAQSAPQIIHPPSEIRRWLSDDVEAAPVHRSQLGLERRRVWLDAMCSKTGYPSWSKGQINARDSAFIWDMLEAVAIENTGELTIAEIGTASGVSTAVLACGVEQFAPTRWRLHAFDLLSYCYFDHERRVGDAAREVMPELFGSVEIHTKCSARDAAEFFQSGGVDLALIDADHRHPSPCLDLLALLPVLAPGAWVLLHDIELDLISGIKPSSPGSQAGPNLLFESWTGRKIREHRDHREESNIGAIQMPRDPLSVRELLLDLIDMPTHALCIRAGESLDTSG